MKAPAFAYRRVASVPEAVEAYAACAGEARYIAGGQTLLPLLGHRRATPALLIDINRIETLRGIREEAGVLRVGPLTRHTETLRSPLVAAHAPLLTQAAEFMAHPAIRNAGTMGGSVAYGDPASELPACLRALNATIEITGAEGVRRVGADAYFLGRCEIDLAPGELVTAILFPQRVAGTRMRFHEFARRRGDYAMVGLAANAVFAGAPDDDSLASIRLAFCSIGPRPMRAPAAEAALTGGPLDADRIRAAQSALAEDLSPEDDHDLSAEARMHLARVLLGRVLGMLREEPA